MAKLTRLDQKIFASDAGAEEVTAFGSTAAGNPVYITDASGVQTELFEKGWNSAVIGETNPIMDDRNAVDMLFSRQLAYLYQTGIPAYSATDTYYKGSIVSFYSTEDDALKLYYSIIDDNTGNSLEDTDKWVEWKSGGGADLPILTFQFTDHELNSVSWAKSSFSWMNGTVYLAAYKHLRNDLAFRYASSTLTVSHSDYTAGTYVRISALDTQISSTDYYAWGISGETDPTKCIFTLTTTLADGVKVFAYKNATTIYQLTAGIVESQTETVGGTTVTYYRAQDGHKIVLADQATNVASIYSATGIAWYFIFDDTNTQFKLPRSNWNFKGTSNDDVGDFVDQSLPNITGNVGSIVSIGTGAFSSEDLSTASIASGSAGRVYNHSFSASLSSSVYQDNANVQEKATRAFLYFYVGNFEQSAIEQTAGINAEDFQQKADTDLGNVNHNGTTLIAHNAMPSETFISLTWGATGFWYTAPADGYYTAIRHSDNSYPANIVGYVYAADGSTFLFGQAMVAPAGSYYAGFTLPMAMGQKAVIFYGNGIADSIRFVYAKGCEPQS